MPVNDTNGKMPYLQDTVKAKKFPTYQPIQNRLETTAMRNAREWQQGGKAAFDKRASQVGPDQARKELQAKKAKKAGNAGGMMRVGGK